MTTPLVSILIPVYNAERYVAATVRSALAQTWPRTEIIAVDDGSTDQSLGVLSGFEAANVRVLSQPNAGASAARNAALREAQGDFIQYLDADDLLSTDKVERQLRLLQDVAPGRVAVCATSHFFDGTDPVADGILDDFGPRLGDSDDPVDWLLRLYGISGTAGMVQPSCWLTPRSVADAAGPWDTAISVDDDGEYFNRILLASSGVRVVTEVGVYYRKYRNGQSLSAARGRRHQRSALTALEHKAERTLRLTTDDRARRTFAKLFIERAFFCYPDYPDLADEALRRHDALGGGCEGDFHFGRLEWVRRLFGWRVACRIRAAKRRFLRRLQRPRQNPFAAPRPATADDGRDPRANENAAIRVPSNPALP
jgi:glycosyltransferase involved in cell wall biosynthesis